MKSTETPIDALDLPSAIHNALAACGRQCMTVERLQRKDLRELRSLTGLSLAQARTIAYAITQYRIRTGQAGNGFNRCTEPGARLLRITLDESERGMIQGALSARAAELAQLLELGGAHDLEKRHQYEREQTRLRWLLSKIGPPANAAPRGHTTTRETNTEPVDNWNTS